MEQEYTQRLEKIGVELDRWLPGPAVREWQDAENVFSENVEKIGDRSMQALLAPVKDIISRGGKRWRPLLMTLICETLGGGDATIPLSPLVEFSHNASLIHDDIEDGSDERRGKPAIHKIYGVDTAINSGSFFYFLSTCCIESCKIENKGQIYKLWAQCLRRLHLGQAIDISWHRNVSFIPTMEEYFVMCGMKTGGLARFAAELGAFAAGAAEPAVRLLGEAAVKLGIGFQILDDVKNLTTGVPGKKRGDDVVEGKKSLPVLFYLHRYTEKQDRVFYCFQAARKDGLSAPEVEELIGKLKDAGLLKEAEEKGRSLITEAREIFKSPEYAGIPVSAEGRALIDGLIDRIS